MAKVTMPQLGESVAEGTIGRWLKKPGDRVEKYEPIVEVITDKVNAEVPSPFAGTLTAILVEEGATVPNETPIAEIEPADAAADVAAPMARTDRERHRSRSLWPQPRAAAAGRARRPGRLDRRSRPPRPRPRHPRPPMGDPDARMTPAVRRLLREHGLAAEQIRGTGGGGRITREDVIATVEAIRTGAAPIAAPAAPGPAAAQASAPPPAVGRPAPSAAPAGAPIVFPPGADEVVVPLTQMRKGIAAQMTRALQVPHAYVHVEVEVTNLVRLRDALKRDYQAREGLSLSYVPFVVKASVEALRRNPTFNAT